MTGCSCFSFLPAPCVGVKRLLQTCAPPSLRIHSLTGGRCRRHQPPSRASAFSPLNGMGKANPFVLQETATGWELEPVDWIKSYRHRDTGISPEAGIHKTGAVSPYLGKEALAQEQLTSWGHTLQIPKALTWISWPMAPFCSPCHVVTPSHPSGKWGQGRGGSTNRPQGKSHELKALLN